MKIMINLGIPLQRSSFKMQEFALLTRKIQIVLFLLLPIFLFAQYETYLQDDPEPTEQAMGGGAFSLLESGSGLGAFYEWPMAGYMHIGGRLNLYMLRDSKQIDGYDYYGYPITMGKKNNVYLIDLGLTFKKRLLAREIDDNMRPYVGASLGPVFGMNFPEDPTLSNEYRWALSAGLAAGVDVIIDGDYTFGLSAQYRYMKFNAILGERQDQSTLDVRLEVGKLF